MSNADYLTARGSAWRLALADLKGDERKELVYGTYEGVVRCMDPETEAHRWEVQLGSFPFDVRAADLDGDGRDEVIVATAAGQVIAIGPAGDVLWTFDSPLPLYNAVAGRFSDALEPGIAAGGVGRELYLLDAQGHCVATHTARNLPVRLAPADLDGDGYEEIVHLDGRKSLAALKVTGGSPELLWHVTPSVPARMRSWHNPALLFDAVGMCTGDVNGDGRPEIVLGSSCHVDHRLLALNADGQEMWLTDAVRWEFRGEVYTEFYSWAMPQVIDHLRDSPSPHVLVVDGGMVRLFTGEGQLVDEATGRVGFSHFCLDGETLYLGSSPNGDDTIYRVDMAGDWVQQVESLGRHGRALRMGRSLKSLRQQVLDYEGTPTGDECYVVRDLRVRPNERSARRYHEYREWHRERFPYENLRYIAGSGVVEETPVLDENGELWSEWQWNQANVRGAMTKDECVGLARWAEESQVPLFVSMGHGCTPLLHLDTAEEMLQAAPEYLEGFFTSEDSGHETAPRYLRHYFSRLLDLCARHGKRASTRNKAAWWMSVPAMADAFDALFGDERGHALLPATEDSNSRTSEINALARFGLRQAGLVPDFTVTLLGDLFCFNRYWQWEYPKHGHPYLRLLVAHTLLGGSSYEFRFKHLRSTKDGFAFSDMGRESTEIFLHMLGKGLVFTPGPHQMPGMSSVGIAVHEPDPRWLADAHNLHRPQQWQDEPALHDAVIPHNAALWGMTQTPPHALQAVLLGKKRQIGQLFATPYGPFAIVPARADLDSVIGVREWWHTDGIDIWREGGPKMRGMQAGEALRDSFASAAKGLPFRPTGDDVFFHTVRLADGRFRIYAMDPGWLDPRPRRVEVHVQTRGVSSFRDALSGEELPQQDGRFALNVPAGSLRIVDEAPDS